MTYTVTFKDAEGVDQYSVFQNVEDARDFIKSRHEGYGSSYKITEESEDGRHKAIVE